MQAGARTIGCNVAADGVETDVDGQVLLDDADIVLAATKADGIVDALGYSGQGNEGIIENSVLSGTVHLHVQTVQLRCQMVLVVW